MDNASNLSQRLELRDSAGNTLSVFVPEAALREMVEERDALRDQLARLQNEVERLHAVERERNAYLHALYSQMQREFRLEPRDIEDMEKNGVAAEQLFAEVEEIVGGK